MWFLGRWADTYLLPDNDSSGLTVAVGHGGHAEAVLLSVVSVALTALTRFSGETNLQVITLSV